MAFFLAVLFESRKMPLVYHTAIGPGFLPVGASLTLIVLSALMFIGGLRRTVDEDRRIEWPRGRGLAQMTGVIAALVFYTVMMPILGYVLSTFAFTFVLIWLLGSYRWSRSAGMGLAITLSSYLVFNVWLSMSLPKSLLGTP